jgi:hypothetical protein
VLPGSLNRFALDSVHVNALFKAAEPRCSPVFTQATYVYTEDVGGSIPSPPTMIFHHFFVLVEVFPRFVEPGCRISSQWHRHDAHHFFSFEMKSEHF